MEEECILGEQAQMQPQGELMEEPLKAPQEQPAWEAGGGRGKGAGEEHQRLILQPILISLDPSAIAQPKDSPLPAASSPDPMYTLPAAQFTPVAQFTPEAPTAKAIPSLLTLQNLKKVVAIVRAFTTTSKTMAAAHIAWHNGWFGCWFGFGAPEPRRC